uniref:Restriction endonuclease subunit R n=1 Tax=Mesocestoides corti TaxID=53468 RepID=A0A5K3EUY8_MESCO
MSENKTKWIEALTRRGKCDSVVDEFESKQLANVMKTTGAERIISNYIPGKLEETGWNERIFEECRRWLKEHTASGKPVFYGQKIREKYREPEDVDPSELVKPLEKIAMSLVPEVVCRELMDHIIKVINENLLD